MKVLVLTRYQNSGASSRVRFYQFFPYLKSKGFKISTQALLSDRYIENIYKQNRKDIIEIIRGYIKRLLILFTVPMYDLLWIEKEIFPGLPAIAERLLKIIGIKMVVDFDDAIFHNYDLNRRLFVKTFLRNKISVVMRCASTVVAGNPYIAEYAKNSKARSIQIIPSVVDPCKYSPKIQNKSESKPVVGWIGTPATVHYVECIAEELLEVQRRHPYILRIIGAELHIPGLELECLPWSEESEVLMIQEFDIGIMPLDNTPWDRGKCGYKLIQYMACGKCCLASAVGVNVQILSDSRLLINSKEEWISKLIRILENKHFQSKFAEMLHRKFLQDYSTTSVSEKLQQILSE